MTSSPYIEERVSHVDNLPSFRDEDAGDIAATHQHITAVIVGASMAGLLTAAALADWCNEVIVIDKDDCADDAATVEELQEEVRCFRHGLVANNSLCPSKASYTYQSPCVELTCSRRDCTLATCWADTFMKNLTQIFQGEARGDTYVSRARRRRGVPQYGQLHGLLGKGAQVIESLLPGWKAIALQLGAISYQPGLLRTVGTPTIKNPAVAQFLLPKFSKFCLYEIKGIDGDAFSPSRPLPCMSLRAVRKMRVHVDFAPMVPLCI